MTNREALKRALAAVQKATERLPDKEPIRMDTIDIIRKAIASEFAWPTANY